MRKLIVVTFGILSLMMSAKSAPMFVEGDYTYSITNETIEIARYNGVELTCKIPETIAGLPVAKIGDFSFNNTSVETVVIPSTVCTIGAKAFIMCRNLTAVTFADGGEKLENIYGDAFSGTKISTIEIPKNVAIMGRDVFKDCPNLVSVKFCGNAPTVSDLDMFSGTTPENLIVFVPSGAIGWGIGNWSSAPATWAGRQVRVYKAGENTEALVRASVEFDGNGATSGSEQTVTTNDESDAVKIPSASKMSRTGYTFIGWNSKPDGTGESFVGNSTLYVYGSFTLYAQWSPIKYTVKFNKNGGSGSMSSQTMTYDTAAMLFANKFTRKDYKFMGWAATKNGRVAYADGEEVRNLSDTNDGTVTLYAVWEREEPAGSEKPDDPKEPENPPAPDDPATPENPATPEEPATPEDPVKPDDPVVPADPVKPEEPETPADPVDPNPPVDQATESSPLESVEWISPFTDVDANKLKRTYDGFVMDGDSIVGLATLTVTGKTTAPKLTVKVTLANGNLTLKATRWERNADGMYEATLAATKNTLDLCVGDGVASGQLNDMAVYLARNFAVDKTSQTGIKAFVGDYTAAVRGDTVAGYLQFSAKAAKGAVTVKGAIADGTVISAKTTMLDFGVGKVCIPVFTAKKNKYALGALLWVSPNGVSLMNDPVYIPNWDTPTVSDDLSIDGAKFVSTAVEGSRQIILGELPDYFDKKAGSIPAVEDASPHELAVTVAKGKIVTPEKMSMPKKNKDGSYKYNGSSDAGLKLTYKVATGVLSGSFKLYYDWTGANGKTQHKAVTAKVQGVAAGDSFVGFASVPQTNPELKKVQKTITFALEIR